MAKDALGGEEAAGGEPGGEAMGGEGVSGRGERRMRGGEGENAACAFYSSHSSRRSS